MATRMKQRRGTAAEWAAQNPILEDGEIGVIKDEFAIKVGDGVTAWNDLTAFRVVEADHALTAALAADSSLLQGLDASAFLPVAGKAADSELLDGLNSTQFLRSDVAGAWTITQEFYAALAAIFGDSDSDRVEQKAFVVETHQRSTELTYTAGVLTQVVEKAGTTTVRTTTLNYTDGVLTSTVEVAGGKTITTTLVYTNGILTSTTRAVA